MPQIKITIEGADKMRAALKKGSTIAPGYISRALDSSIKIVESNAKREAPVNRSPGITGGNLRQSISSRMASSFSAVVSVGVAYAVAVHEGTRPHVIRPVVKRALANIRTGQFFGKIVHHPGTRANPFLQRAVDNSESYIKEQFQKAVENIKTAITF